MNSPARQWPRNRPRRRRSFAQTIAWPLAAAFTVLPPAFGGDEEKVIALATPKDGVIEGSVSTFHARVIGIDNPFGNIRVSFDNDTKIRARIAGAAVDAFSIVFVEDRHGRIYVRVQYPFARAEKAPPRIDVTLPACLIRHLQVLSRSGDIDVRDLGANPLYPQRILAVETLTGRARVRNVSFGGGVQIHAAKVETDVPNASCGTDLDLLHRVRDAFL